VGLPDALDLTVICVEAGLALDQALMRVGEDLSHAHPELSSEFHLVNLEMRAGKPRVEALHGLAERTGVSDIRALVATLVQTTASGPALLKPCAYTPTRCAPNAANVPKNKPLRPRLRWSFPCIIYYALPPGGNSGPSHD